MRELHQLGYETFWENRCAIVEAFARGKLYKVEIIETTELRENTAFREGMMNGMIPSWHPQWYVDIPAFITLDFYGSIELLWVHPSIRRMRFGTKLIRGVPHNRRIGTATLDGSEAFWGRFPELIRTV
jgi:ribosomal protein S18 acetylase RimI-like enzyme